MSCGASFGADRSIPLSLSGATDDLRGRSHSLPSDGPRPDAGPRRDGWDYAERLLSGSQA